jgi:ketosteroid isomerase-like protein
LATAFVSKSIVLKVPHEQLAMTSPCTQPSDSPLTEAVDNKATDENNQDVSSDPSDQEGSKEEQEEDSTVVVTMCENVIPHVETIIPHIEIVQALERQCAAWNERDIKKYMNGYATDAIYISQSILKTRPNSPGEKKNDICLHGRIAIAMLFADVMQRSQKQLGKLSYRQLQIPYATADRAFVIGRYEFTISKDHKVLDEGVFTLDMACVLDEAGDNGETREWRIKTEHASSSLKQRMWS